MSPHASPHASKGARRADAKTVGSNDHWRFSGLCHLTKWVMERWGAPHVQATVLMACPDQVSSLQGSLGVSREFLAANDLGTGSGWQQSKQNWALLTVAGARARTGSLRPLWCRTSATPPFFRCPPAKSALLPLAARDRRRALAHKIAKRLAFLGHRPIRGSPDARKGGSKLTGGFLA